MSDPSDLGDGPRERIAPFVERPDLRGVRSKESEKIVASSEA